MQNMDDSNWQNSKGHGSGVAGGPKGSEQQQSTQSSGQKNWPEHGTEAVGQKAGMNTSDQNAASASTFIDEETPEYCEALRKFGRHGAVRWISTCISSSQCSEV
ncbi:hypothetical protein BKA93DRAFT_323507 [Sparassis latifolia]